MMCILVHTDEQRRVWNDLGCEALAWGSLETEQPDVLYNIWGHRLASDITILIKLLILCPRQYGLLSFCVV